MLRARKAFKLSVANEATSRCISYKRINRIYIICTCCARGITPQNLAWQASRYDSSLRLMMNISGALMLRKYFSLSVTCRIRIETRFSLVFRNRRGWANFILKYQYFQLSCCTSANNTRQNCPNMFFECANMALIFILDRCKRTKPYNRSSENFIRTRTSSDLHIPSL